jgi:preprotein translocase subunit SecG
VRVATGIFASIFCVTFILMYFFWTELDEEVCRLVQ